MSRSEYKKWERQEVISVGKEWTELRMARLGHAYSLQMLKESIDSEVPGWGPHDLMVEVDSKTGEEFSLVTREERFGEGAGCDLMQPLRYVNIHPLSFERVQVVYDPENGIDVDVDPELTLADLFEGLGATFDLLLEHVVRPFTGVN